jgi:lysophospholipase L1-like esterase
MSIVELARANDIRVVLASLTPICDCYTKQSTLRPQGKIIGMNGWLRDYAANLKKELTGDGLLPNDAGYAVMAPLADAAIAQALSKK